MNRVVDLDPAAYDLIGRLAVERHDTVKRVLRDVLLSPSSTHLPQIGEVFLDDRGFPVLRVGRPVTLEEVRAAIEED